MIKYSTEKHEIYGEVVKAVITEPEVILFTNLQTRIEIIKVGITQNQLKNLIDNHIKEISEKLWH